MAWVERLFRTFKSAELELRPIHHRLTDRVRAHALLCLHASYVEWHMRRAWAPLLFDDKASPDATQPRSRPRTALPSRKQGASPSPTPFVLRSASAPSLPHLSNRAKRAKGLRADPKLHGNSADPDAIEVKSWPLEDMARGGTIKYRDSPSPRNNSFR